MTSTDVHCARLENGRSPSDTIGSLFAGHHVVRRVQQLLMIEALTPGYTTFSSKHNEWTTAEQQTWLQFPGLWKIPLFALPTDGVWMVHRHWTKVLQTALGNYLSESRIAATSDKPVSKNSSSEDRGGRECRGIGKEGQQWISSDGRRVSWQRQFDQDGTYNEPSDA